MGRIPSLAAQYYPITPAWPAGSPRVAGKTSLAVGPTYQPLGARALVTWPPTCGPHWSVASSTEDPSDRVDFVEDRVGSRPL
jgi:hypothetical protein